MGQRADPGAGLIQSPRSVGSSKSRPGGWNLLSHCHTIEPPLDAAAADRVETRLKKFRRHGYAEEIGDRALKAGLLISVVDDRTFTLFPALNVSRAVADKGLDILENGL